MTQRHNTDDTEYIESEATVSDRKFLRPPSFDPELTELLLELINSSSGFD